jgi:hypothetical protein
MTVDKATDLSIIAYALKLCEEHFDAKTYALANKDGAQREAFRKLAAINDAQTALNRLRNER